MFWGAIGKIKRTLRSNPRKNRSQSAEFKRLIIQDKTQASLRPKKERDHQTESTKNAT